MDLHRTASHAPVRDAERHSYNASDPLPGSDAWLAGRRGEEAALEDLEAQITELWGNINAATAHFLTLLAEFDRREGWAQHGVSSCAHWLSWQCGIGGNAAREKVRVARALESLPKIRAAFGEGRLSYSKVRALTRGATAETEEDLLHIALNGTAAHVERTVRGFRRAVRNLERDEAKAIQERRYLDCRREADGSVRLEARLAPEVGEMLLKALEAAHAELEVRDGETEKAEAPEPAVAADADANSADVSAETSKTQSARWYRLCRAPENVSAETPARSVSQRRADALGHVLERFLAGKAQEDCFRGNNPAAGGARRLAAFNAERGLNIDAQTARCRWRGERMDYDIAIDGLCWKAGYT